MDYRTFEGCCGVAEIYGLGIEPNAEVLKDVTDEASDEVMFGVITIADYQYKVWKPILKKQKWNFVKSFLNHTGNRVSLYTKTI